MKKRLLRSLTAIAALFLLISGTYVAAQNSESGGSGIQISPTRTEVSLDKGASKDVTITVKNITPGPIVARAYLHDFESDDETGEPRLIVDPKETSAYSLRRFVKNLNDVNLNSGETKTVTFSLVAPADASPGAYFGAVRFAAIPQGSDNRQEEPQVGLTASVAHLLLVTVPGDVQVGAKLEKVGVERNGKSASIFIQPPLTGFVRVNNTGNGFIKPFGKVVVSKGGKEVYSYELNNRTPRSNVLPKSSRTFKDPIRNVSSFGRYTITANVSHTDGGEVISMSKSFWVIPVWLLVILAALLGAIFLTIFLWNKRAHRYRIKIRRKKK